MSKIGSILDTLQMELEPHPVATENRGGSHPTSSDPVAAESEYMTVAEAAKEALWLSGLSKELGVEQGGVQLHCDSQSAIYLAKNQVYYARTKHIDVRYHKIRELIASREIIL
ncbi:UNVERIFIED_CONTAM: Retrovirus-related Pol polyprotein from transposon TNT 1-94 [Sesamum calycinum]|uniref:Retrovirus-related Pol polyprotein from transposon TNT 1-94 n=1 Tax=Sesamum calycinum TaxID=2727403 RepID=A0AAW2JKM4_9LAMI